MGNQPGLHTQLCSRKGQGEQNELQCEQRQLIGGGRGTGRTSGSPACCGIKVLFQPLTDCPVRHLNKSLLQRQKSDSTTRCQEGLQPQALLLTAPSSTAQRGHQGALQETRATNSPE